MIQVKEFLNYQNAQDTNINEWLKKQDESIEVISIKYSVGTFSTDDEFSGVLIIYKLK